MRERIRIIRAFPVPLLLWSLCGCGSSSSSTTPPSSHTPASVIATIPVGTSPNAVAVNPTTNRIYVANTGDQPATVSVIDGATNSVIATVPVGASADGIAVNPVTNKIYVAANPFLTVIDGATNSPTNVNLGLTIGDLAVNSVTNKIYMPNYALQAVAVIDGATYDVTTLPLELDVGPSPLAINTVTNTIYVGDGVRRDITAIDGATNQTQTMYVGLIPGDFAINTVNNQVFLSVGLGGQTWVDIIDGATLAITNSVDKNNPAGGITGNIAVNATTNKLYVPHQLGSVAAVDVGTLNLVSVSVGQLPKSVTVDEQINQIYVPDGWLSAAPPTMLTVIDGATNSTTRLMVGAGPSDAALNPVTHRVYVANSCGNVFNCNAVGPVLGTVAVIEAAH